MGNYDNSTLLIRTKVRGQSNCMIVSCLVQMCKCDCISLPVLQACHGSCLNVEECIFQQRTPVTPHESNNKVVRHVQVITISISVLLLPARDPPPPQKKKEKKGNERKQIKEFKRKNECECVFLKVFFFQTVYLPYLWSFLLVFLFSKMAPLVLLTVPELDIPFSHTEI